MIILNQKESENLGSQIKKGKIHDSTNETNTVYLFRLQDGNWDDVFLLNINRNSYTVDSLLTDFHIDCETLAEEEGTSIYDYYDSDSFIDFLEEKGIKCKRVGIRDYLQF